MSFQGEDTARYRARVFRHKALKKPIIEQIETLVYALLNEAKTVEYRRIDEPDPRSDYAPRMQWSAHVDQWFAQGRTREQALIHLLGNIYGDACWFPKT